MRSIFVGLAMAMAVAASSCFTTPGYLVSGFAFALFFLYFMAEIFIPLGREDWETPTLFQTGLSAVLHLVLAAALYTVTSHESMVSARFAWMFFVVGIAGYGLVELGVFLVRAAAEDMMRKAQQRVEQADRELEVAQQHLLDDLVKFLGQSEESGS